MAAAGDRPDSLPDDAVADEGTLEGSVQICGWVDGRTCLVQPARGQAADAGSLPDATDVTEQRVACLVNRSAFVTKAPGPGGSMPGRKPSAHTAMMSNCSW